MQMNELVNTITVQAVTSTQNLLTIIVQVIEAVDISTTLVGEERAATICGTVKAIYDATNPVLPYDAVSGEIAEMVDAVLAYYLVRNGC